MSWATAGSLRQVQWCHKQDDPLAGSNPPAWRDQGLEQVCTFGNDSAA
jgi:hypothetical protein